MIIRFQLYTLSGFDEQIQDHLIYLHFRKSRFCVKVLDLTCQTTGCYVQPPASLLLATRKLKLAEVDHCLFLFE